MRIPGLSKLTDRARLARNLRRGVGEGISRAKQVMETIDSRISARINLSLPLEELRARLETQPGLDFIHVDHSAVSKLPGQSLIDLARKNAETKAKLILLANAGFHVYVLREGVSSLVRHRRIRRLWREVIAGTVSVDENDIFYTLERATGPGEPRLLVVFSSIAAKMYTPSLMRHFETNFASLPKYVPQNTHILRIADFGGVVGSFYLNSLALPQNEAHLWGRIAATAAELKVARDNIVLYGASKGGTAATFHALRHGLRAVAVDPILSDEHYVKAHHDLHFTQGTFAAPKQARFQALIRNELHPETQLSLICSRRSPQFAYIEPMLITPLRDRFLFLNSENPAIEKHPDVGPKTVAHTLSQLNLHLAGLVPPAGFHTVW